MKEGNNNLSAVETMAPDYCFWYICMSTKTDHSVEKQMNIHVRIITWRTHIFIVTISAGIQ
jgi:hypothetical protein